MSNREGIGFRPSELLLPISEWSALAESRRKSLRPDAARWLASWEMWDLACSPMDDSRRSLYRYANYLGWVHRDQQAESEIAALRAKVERLEGDKLRLREVVQKSAAAAESFKPALERLLMQIELGFVERVGLRRKFRAAHTQLAAVLRETEANTETGRK